MAEGAGFYQSMEDKYYDFLDMLDSKGIPIYKVVNAIEAQNIPSFPVAIAFSLIVLALLVWGISGLLLPAGAELTVIVEDSQGYDIEGAIVTVTPQGSSALSPLATNTDGEAKFNVPMNVPLAIGAKKQGYGSANESFTATQGTATVSVTLTEEGGTEHRIINLVKAGTSELVTGFVEIEFSCSGNSWSQEKSTTSGVIEIEVPSDCGTLYAFPGTGWTTGSGGQDNFDFESRESFTMYLSGESEESGRAYVTVTDRDGMPLAGISVSLVAVGGTIEGIRETPSSGTANFTDVPAGRYYVTAYDTTGTYAEYDSRNSGYDGTKDLLPGGALDFRVVLEDEVIGTIKLQVLDSGTLAGIAGAEVTLSKDGAVIDTEYSDNAGMLEFKVGEDVGYDLSFDKEGYLIESLKDVKPGTDYRKVMLTPATEENSMSLAVSVVDEGKGPVEDVRLRLKIASDGTPVGDEIATGANGKAVFERLEEGNYYVYAYKPGFGEENSGNVYVSAREENSVEIVLRIGKGNIEANVLDAQKQAVAGASVKLVNFRTMETMESKVADSKGYVKFEVRADKKVFLVVNAAGFMSHTTIPVMPVKDVTRKFEISLEKAVSGLQVKFMGLYVGDQRIGDADGLVNAGGLYTAKMLLLIPAGSSFGEAGAHFRTGAADSGIMEKDYLYITNVRAAYDSVIRGTSYNPPNGYAKDAEHFTSGNAKWANVYFADAAGGVYEIEMDVQVSDAAPNGAALDAWYRGWGKSGSYIRFPSDRALGGAESNAEKHGLYAQANNRKYTVGLASPCYENFCASFTIEDLAEQIKTAVMDEYVADEGANYRLAFSITSTSESMLSGAKLRISDNVGSLALGGYEVITAAGERMKDDAKGRAIEIEAGDVAKDGIIQGTVDFKAVKDGSALLELEIISEGMKVFDQDIRFSIEPAKELTIEVIPKVIVPYVNNNLLVHVTGSGGITGAQVEIRKDGAIIGQGETDAEGTFAYVLRAPSAGSALEIIVVKPGYKAAKLGLTVNENILLVRPAEIKEQLTLGAEEEKDVTILLENLTVMPLLLEKMEESGEFGNYVSFDFADTEFGKLLDINSDANAEFTISAFGKGRDISKPETIEGHLNIYAGNSEFKRTWVTQVPAEIRIGFGAETDDPECFNLFPTEWQIFTGTGKKTLKVTLTNQCEVAGDEISLRKLQARVVSGAENELGKFRVSSDLEDGTVVEITNKFQVVAREISAGAENSITIEFLPADIASGAAEYGLEFVALNYTEDGDEELKEIVNAEVHIDNLAECVEIVQDRELIIETAGINTGWGNYGNYFSGGYGGQQGGFPQSGYGTGYGTQGGGYGSNGGYFNPAMNNWDMTYKGQGQTNYMGSYNYLDNSYPSSSYNYPFYASDFYNDSSRSQWNSGRSGLTKFTVKNNCASTIEVQVDPDPALLVQDTAFEVESLNDADVEVRAQYAVGRYPIKVKARVAGSNEAAVDVETIYVTIENSFTKTYTDCISVEPARTIKFGLSIIAKPKLLKVRNTCYNEGVRLMPSTNGINFTGAMTPVQSEGVGSEVVKQWSVVGAPSYVSRADGGVTETVTYEIVKNIAWHDGAAKLVNAENPIHSLFNLRYELTSAYYAIYERTTLYVNFTNRYGQSQGIPFSMIIEDYWEGAGFIPEGLIPTYGSADCSVGKCLNADAMDFKKYYNGDCIPTLHLNREFSSADNGGLLKFSEKVRDPKTRGLKETSGFGTGDTIYDLSAQGMDKDGWVDVGQGVRAQFRISAGKQNIIMKLDRGTWDGKEQVDGIIKLNFRVNRMRPSYKDVPLFITVRFCIKPLNGKAWGTETAVTPPAGIEVGESTTGIAGETGQECEKGEAYYLYGFNRLLWDWRYTEGKEGVQADDCDYATNELDAEALALKPKNLALKDAENSAYFCDGTQFSIALNWKADNIWNAVMGSTVQCLNPMNVQNLCIKESVNLQSHTVEQVVVEDSYKGYKHVFFVGTDNRIISRGAVLEKKDVGTQALQGLLQAIMDYPTVKETESGRILGNTNDILENKANQGQKWFSDVLAVVDVTEEKGIYEKYYDAIDMEYIQAKGGLLKARVMTLGEFYAFDDGIEKANNCPQSQCSINLARATGAPKDAEITSEFVKHLQDNVYFVYGIRNYTGITPDERKEALLKGGGEELLKVYLKNIDFDALLMGDGYSENFRKDFDVKYSAHKISNWAFDTGGKLESGMHHVLFNYNWGSKAANVKFSAPKNLAALDKGLNAGKGNSKEMFKFAKNPLLAMPFDGEVGIKDGKIDRALYGIGISAKDYAESGITETVYAKADNENIYKFTDFKPGNYWATYMLHYKSDWENTYEGRILKFDGDNITFSPTDPIGLNVQISNNPPLRKELVGMVYDISNNRWSLDKMKKPLDWTVAQNTLGSGHAIGSVLSGEMMHGKGVCSTWLQQWTEWPGVRVDAKTAGKLVIEQMVYAPVVAGTVKKTELEVRCRDDDPEHYITVLDDEINRLLKNSDGGTLNGEIGGRLGTHYTWKQIFEMISTEGTTIDGKDDSKRGEYVCVKEENGGLNFYWNRDRIMKNLSAAAAGGSAKDEGLKSEELTQKITLRFTYMNGEILPILQTREFKDQLEVHCAGDALHPVELTPSQTGIVTVEVPKDCEIDEAYFLPFSDSEGKWIEATVSEYDNLVRLIIKIPLEKRN